MITRRRYMGNKSDNWVQVEYLHMAGAQVVNLSVPTLGYAYARIMPLQPDYYNTYAQYIYSGTWSSSYTTRFIIYRLINSFVFNREHYGKNVQLGKSASTYGTYLYYTGQKVASSNGILRIGDSSAYTNMNFYYFYMYDSDNTTLAIDLIPVRVGTKGYIYDRVSGTLYEPTGGDVELGPDV